MDETPEIYSASEKPDIQEGRIANSHLQLSLPLTLETQRLNEISSKTIKLQGSGSFSNLSSLASTTRRQQSTKKINGKAEWKKLPWRAIFYRKHVLYWGALFEFLSYLTKPIIFAMIFEVLLYANPWIPEWISKYGIIFYFLWSISLVVLAVDIYELPQDDILRMKKQKSIEKHAYISGFIYLILTGTYLVSLVTRTISGKTTVLELVMVGSYTIPLIVNSILRKCFTKVLLFGVQSLLMEPFYYVMIPITAVLHWTQGSWGTRGKFKDETNEHFSKDRTFATYVLIFNAIIVIVIGVTGYFAQEKKSSTVLYIFIGVIIITSNFPEIITIFFIITRRKKTKIKEYPGIYIFKEDLISTLEDEDVIKTKIIEYDSDSVQIDSSSTSENIDVEAQIENNKGRSFSKNPLRREAPSFTGKVPIPIGLSNHEIAITRDTGTLYVNRKNIINVETVPSPLTRNNSTSVLFEKLPKAFEHLDYYSSKYSLERKSTAINMPIVIMIPVYKEPKESLRHTVTSVNNINIGLIEGVLSNQVGNKDFKLNDLLIVFVHDEKPMTEKNPKNAVIGEQFMDTDLSSTWKALKSLVLGMKNSNERPLGRRREIKDRKFTSYYKRATKNVKAKTGYHKPVNFHYCVLKKMKNMGKRDSQILFYQYIEFLMKRKNIKGVKYVFNIDSDTSFNDDVPAKLLEPIMKDQSISSSCARLKIRSETDNWKPVLASQSLEYAISFEIKKWVESVYRTVKCIPGALMAIKYSALKQEIMDNPSSKYQIPKHEIKKTGTPNEASFMWNRLEIGEDRWMTTVLILNKNYHGTVYVSSAIGYTCPPKTMWDLLLQRRRWTNSSLANLAYIINNTYHQNG